MLYRTFILLSLSTLLVSSPNYAAPDVSIDPCEHSFLPSPGGGHIIQSPCLATKHQ